MPRKARQLSENGIYHIMLRGINQQQIFEDEEDNKKYLRVLDDYKKISGYKIFAYCLMGNHVHLLLKTEGETLDHIFKRIGCKYVSWYNEKYGRTGHLFQDRFKSEPIMNERHLFAVLRYIHLNPLKAGMEKRMGEYPWSSFHDYASESKTCLTDVSVVLGIMEKEKFLSFHERTWEPGEVDGKIIKNVYRVTDHQAREVIYELSGCKTVAEFQDLGKRRRDEVLLLLNERGLPNRQISRLTGMSRGLVEKKVKNKDRPLGLK